MNDFATTKGGHEFLYGTMPKLVRNIEANTLATQELANAVKSLCDNTLMVAKSSLISSIWIISGYTTNIGNWEIEIFTDESQAKSCFKQYKKEYGFPVSKDDEYYCLSDDGVSWFSLEERPIDVIKR